MKLKHTELSFQLMMEASPIALILVNNLGKIAYLNSFSEKLFKYNKDELTGQNIGILLSERNKSHHPELMKNYFNNPISRKMGENQDLTARKKTGEEFPVEVGLNPIVTQEGTLVLAAIVDITERKNSNKQFRLVVESAPNAMVLVNEKGIIVMVNKQTEVLFGYERNELVGKKMEILVPQRIKNHHPQLRKSFHADSKARPMGAGRDLFGVRKDGVEIPLEIGLNPLEKNDGQLVLASIIDITERKKNEEAIRLYTKRIEGKNKELEQFTYIASHDLREPLNSITSLIDVLADRENQNLNEDSQKILKFINKSAFRMTELINGLLDYARLGKNSEITKIDLNDVIKYVLHDLSSSIIESGAKIQVDKLPVINAYEVEIRLMFQNLISNALKYKKTEVNPEIFISAKKVTNGWEFAVSDNGIGIPPSQTKKIFILFQRLHGRNEYSGIGIGLAHCRKIAELHDGKIWVESELDAGSTFHFFIPSKLK